MKLEKNVAQRIKQISPEHSDVLLSPDFKSLMIEVEGFIKKNHQIYQDRKKYNLHWAFESSQKKMNRYFEGFAIQKIQEITETMKDNNCEICNKFVGRFKNQRKNRIKRRMRIYSITSFFVTLLDVVLSFLMVLTISTLGNFGKGIFESGILAILFVVFVALLKVSLDKFYITPTVHKWGWQMFDRINQNFKRNITTALAILFVLDQLTREKNSEAIPVVVKTAEEFVQKL